MYMGKHVVFKHLFIIIPLRTKYLNSGPFVFLVQMHNTE